MFTFIYAYKHVCRIYITSMSESGLSWSYAGHVQVTIPSVSSWLHQTCHIQKIAEIHLAEQICVSLCRGHAKLLCSVSVLVFVFKRVWDDQILPFPLQWDIAPLSENWSTKCHAPAPTRESGIEGAFPCLASEPEKDGLAQTAFYCPKHVCLTSMWKCLLSE